jgi:hypothetical protein
MPAFIYLMEGCLEAKKHNELKDMGQLELPESLEVTLKKKFIGFR